MKSTPRMAPLIAELVRKEVILRSGSGSNPKPGEKFICIFSILAPGRTRGAGVLSNRAHCEPIDEAIQVPNLATRPHLISQQDKSYLLYRSNARSATNRDSPLACLNLFSPAET